MIYHPNVCRLSHNNRESHCNRINGTRFVNSASRDVFKLMFSIDRNVIHCVMRFFSVFVISIIAIAIKQIERVSINTGNWLFDRLIYMQMIPDENNSFYLEFVPSNRGSGNCRVSVNNILHICICILMQCTINRRWLTHKSQKNLTRTTTSLIDFADFADLALVFKWPLMNRSICD